MPIAELTEITDLDTLIDQLDERVTTADSGAENMSDTIGVCTLLLCTAIIGLC
ncbi:hypothetical protein [Streptomyces qinzhouensis]|uniref:hypothetical protein n=1 Tax=Streptomyces qinzhouensis TaxID=2599401 RepID=UPI001646B482|nr:hypothetical protein [Streptomyces qinzhouensis]